MFMNERKLLQYFVLFYIIASVFTFIFVNQVVEVDYKFSSFVMSFSNPFFDFFFSAVTFLGSIIFWMLAAALLWMHKDKKMATFLFIGLILEEILTVTMKFWINRPRPDFATINEFGPSFPSSHTARAALGLVIIKYYRPVIAAVVILVALSRVYLGVHYLSDVVFGVMNGILIGLLIKNLPVDWIKKRLQKIYNKLDI